MRTGDIPPSHHEVFDVGAIESLKGDVVGLFDFLRIRRRLVPVVKAARRVFIERPPADAYTIISVFPVAGQVVLSLDVGSGEAAKFG